MASGGGDEVEVNGAFIGAGCNIIVNNVPWGACDLVAFGAQNADAIAIAIFSPKSAQILTTFSGHKFHGLDPAIILFQSGMTRC
ncbi:elongator complex protein 2-like isoform X4 [Cucurbita pepo subsp. pepo]|uniref:elongator complex protein 2-like isoform X4 n=1 Tax=Cucurbita pepo subsp. pepo TaxID=3664 RepID=UPI000C9D8953|nr:elongator complex protein 2-like isoform X4 [Cucurbita pepo subsp. pepo]